MSMQGQPDQMQPPLKGSPRVAIQFEHPPELLQHLTDQIETLDVEIREWEERLWRLRTCRDSISTSAQYLNEVLSQGNPSMTVPSYSR